MSRERWLNGWPRNETAVFIGTGVHCIGCGADCGVTCVGFEEGWKAPEKMPEWPFEQDSCPICLLTSSKVPKGPTLDQRLAAFKAAKQRLSPQEPAE
jgi:hypothetical protein